MAVIKPMMARMRKKTKRACRLGFVVMATC
jgi:hypothetical protein